MLCTNLINQIKHVQFIKTRLYSSCLTTNIINNRKIIHDKRICNKDVQRRNFSLQDTIESIIKTQTGIFKSISESVPVSYTQDFILNIHSTTGLPWWASIILTTIILRSLITVPLAIYQNYILAKVENIQIEMKPIVLELRKETALAIKKFNLTERQAKILFSRSLKKQWNNLIVRDNCHPFKAGLLLWIQIPMWICLSVSFRNLVYMLPKSDVDAQITFLELSAGGFGWIPNLVVPDSSFILPCLLGLINLMIIEIQAASKTKPPTKLQNFATNLIRGITILMVPISATVPSCLTLYWVSSCAYGLVQNLVLMSPKIKRLTGIPKCPSEIDKPYNHVASKLKNKYLFIKV